MSANGISHLEFKRQRQETKNNVKPFSKIKAPKNTRYYGEY